MKSTTTTILLLLVAAALGAYVFFIERDQPDTRTLTTEPPLRFSPDAARFITIARGGETVALKRGDDDNRWYLVEPIEDRADQQACADLLETLSTLAIREVILASEFKSGALARADLGLTEDTGIALTVVGAGGPLASIFIGNPGALDDTTYATFPDDPHYPHVYVVETGFNTFGAGAIAALRDPNVLPFPPDRVGRLLLRNGESEVEIFYDPVLGLWKLGKPLQSRADQKAVESLIDKICALRIAGFEENSEEIAATITGNQSIAVWTIDPETGAVPASGDTPSIVLDIAATPATPNAPPAPPVPAPPAPGNEPPPDTITNPGDSQENNHTLAKVSDREAVLRVPAELAELLATNPNALRDPHLAQIPEKIIRGIIVDSANNPDVILTNNGRRWISLRNGAWEPANERAIDTLLRQLNKEKVIDFVADTSANLADFDLAPPSIRIGLTTSRTVMLPGVQPPPPPPPVDDPDSPAAGSVNIDETEALNYVLGLGRIPASDQNDFERVYATFADEPFVVSIDPAFLANVPLHPLGWKDPSVLAFNIIELREITISRNANAAPPADPGASDSTRLAYNPFAGTWQFTRGDTDLTPQLDPGKAHALVENLGSLAARDWLTQRREAAYAALDQPALTIVVLRSILSEDGDKDVDVRTTLTFAPVAGSDPTDPTHLHYGRLNDSPDIFLLENKTLHTLLTPLTK